MPPKVKQPVHRQIDDTSFDRNRFWEKQAETQYDDIWVYKPVVIERFWQIDQFKGEDFLLQQNFEGRQWLGLARFHSSCVVDTVREFFANVKEKSISRRKGRERIISWVRGVEIVLTPNDFSQVFQLPRIENPEFSYPAEGTPPLSIITKEILLEGQTWIGEYRKPVSILNDKYWALHMFSCTNLFPQNRNADCTPLRARLIYAIGTGMTIDLPSYFWHHIVYTYEHPAAPNALPFGGALTEIFRRKGAQITDDMPLAAGLNPFNIVSYCKSRGSSSKSKKQRTETDEDASGSHAPPDEGMAHEVPNAEFNSQIGALAERLSHLESNQEEDHQILLQIQRSQQTQGHLLQSILDHLRDSSYPPPH